jgi:hypothetical protein
MAEPNQSSEPDNQGHKARVTAHLLHHIIIAAKTTTNGPKSKNKPKEKKETKTKEFVHNFENTQENYLALLKTILLKHGEEKYNVTEKMTYGIKVQLAGVKYDLQFCINPFLTCLQKRGLCRHRQLIRIHRTRHRYTRSLDT